MRIDDKIIDEKLHCNIKLIENQQEYLGYHQTKLIKCEYLPDQSVMIELAKFKYYPLGIVFEKQIKTIENQGKKQVKVVSVLNLMLS